MSENKARKKLIRRMTENIRGLIRRMTENIRGLTWRMIEYPGIPPAQSLASAEDWRRQAFA